MASKTKLTYRLIPRDTIRAYVRILETTVVAISKFTTGDESSKLNEHKFLNMASGLLNDKSNVWPLIILMDSKLDMELEKLKDIAKDCRQYFNHITPREATALSIYINVCEMVICTEGLESDSDGLVKNRDRVTFREPSNREDMSGFEFEDLALVDADCEQRFEQLLAAFEFADCKAHQLRRDCFCLVRKEEGLSADEVMAGE
ncbi:hypothetical protein P280DRAFT_21057 [Massarina eburnea CBS 473.64]|uniref:Uncharacterized protein n=1 Tax=Massarina eburnea CBS 473.64 TaxID=1395130 RepID=A0A6A6SGH1_9PLEO|nr:hypothetical protein P280DRAFT_21057 [Massarina eburnea CBS 473.64]